ncbi:MAG: hypothetical protein ACE5R4_12370 [Armatimonadota bacterium]
MSRKRFLLLVAAVLLASVGLAAARMLGRAPATTSRESENVLDDKLIPNVVPGRGPERGQIPEDHALYQVTPMRSEVEYAWHGDIDEGGRAGKNVRIRVHVADGPQGAQLWAKTRWVDNVAAILEARSLTDVPLGDAVWSGAGWGGARAVFTRGPFAVSVYAGGVVEDASKSLVDDIARGIDARIQQCLAGNPPPPPKLPEPLTQPMTNPPKLEAPPEAKEMSAEEMIPHIVPGRGPERGEIPEDYALYIVRESPHGAQYRWHGEIDEEGRAHKTVSIQVHAAEGPQAAGSFAWDVWLSELAEPFDPHPLSPAALGEKAWSHAGEVGARTIFTRGPFAVSVYAGGVVEDASKSLVDDIARGIDARIQQCLAGNPPPAPELPEPLTQPMTNPPKPEPPPPPPSAMALQEAEDEGYEMLSLDLPDDAPQIEVDEERRGRMLGALRTVLSAFTMSHIPLHFAQGPRGAELQVWADWVNDKEERTELLMVPGKSLSLYVKADFRTREEFVEACRRLLKVPETAEVSGESTAEGFILTAGSKWHVVGKDQHYWLVADDGKSQQKVTYTVIRAEIDLRAEGEGRM